jgi:predicted metal-dependent phosphotriesterase family hydrolase
VTTDAIHTVLGPVDPEDVGACLPHEHLVIDYGELLGSPKQVPEAGSPLETRVIAGVHGLASAGVTLLVDCTPPGYGRYPDLLAKVSAETGVHIVACTGGFTEQWAPLHPVTRALDTDALADMFVRELTEGMGGTRYRAGAIKVATGEGSMTEGEARIFRAAARAHLRTGAPIITHTTNGLGPHQVDFLVREGADPTKIVIGHLGFEPDPKTDIRNILERGANVAFDRIGHHHFFPDSHWVELIRFTLDLGYGERVLLSHDAVTEFFGPEPIKAHTFSDYTYLTNHFLPSLRDAGVDEETVNLLVRENPRTILAYPGYGVTP